ncbi:kinase-like domain-containing protein [Gigaspora rosea]|uniref:Kinase-like domain-containing protein n=1 Tax=Gigaspora rosea TaxID=44941 RepID=A0A397USN9_9GLOM|nr:kinase-like domain-containing protein [Gigaspora rosea]
MKKTTQRFVKELKNLRKVCKHPNIIEFYGVTRDQRSIHNSKVGREKSGTQITLWKLQPRLRGLRTLEIITFILIELRIYAIDYGGFGLVYKAKWKDCGLAIALKQLNIIPTDKNSIRRFVKELKNIQKVCNKHPNIIEFYGVTRALQKYSIHDKKILIADFGLSKDETSKTSNASVHGMHAYIDPQCLENVSYKRSKKSDIYSFGVILWEISSGRPPFQSFAKIPYGIIFHVSKGGRVKPVEGTPDSYIQLYKRCWNYDPNQRPELEEIQESL